MKKNFIIDFEGKRIVVKDYTICATILSKIRGLMFRGKNYKKPLLFLWNKPVLEPIHSFFCEEFIAIWYLDNKIVDVKKVKPWKFSVTPKGKFDSLLEIPSKYL